MRTLFRLLSILLIVTFLWRAFTPSHEYPMRPAQLMSMGFDLLSLVGVIYCWFALPPEFRANTGSRVLCVAAVVAGIGLFAIRLHSDASCWTGHFNYSLEN